MQRVKRALNSRAKPAYDYVPGELVFFWRTQEADKTRRQAGGKLGSFLGPARVLATETCQGSGGQLRPGSAVWLVRGRSLIKCAPEQLRRASEREELIEVLSDSQRQTPWTFTRVASEIGGNQYQDLSHDLPSLAEWQRSQNIEEEAPPVRTRVRQKRRIPEAPEMGEDMDQDEDLAARDVPASARARGSSSGGPSEPSLTGVTWWQEVPETAWSAEAASYWCDHLAAVEIELELAESRRGTLQAMENLPAYFVGALKRKAIEVNLKRLSPEDQRAFQEAKAAEVKNFVAAQAFEALPDSMKPNKDQAIGMRWILTWKVKDDGSVKPKARAVLVGYQDPAYEHRDTTAPVMTRQTRQRLLQAAAWKRWTVQKGDVTGAFLQGREYPGDLYCIPTDEICQALNLAPGSVTKLRRACYGLVDAPLEWFRTVSAFLQEIGLERSWSDACSWAYRVNGRLRGMISGHVDDFLFAGGAEDREWQGILDKIRQKFKWGDWDKDEFVQCGVHIKKVETGFELSQPQYVEGMSEIPLNATRRKEKNAPTNEREKTQLRALLGGLSWHAQQVAPHAAAEVSLLLSEVTNSTVTTITKANLLLHHVKKRKDHKMLIHAFNEDEKLALFAWVDAANGNRPGGGSTQGIFVGMGPESILQGDMGKVTPISWHSSKIDRTCRSPGAAETQAAVNGEDILHYARFQWSELLYGNVDIKQQNATVRQTTGCVITDSRNVFDKINTEVVSIKGAERKANLELLSLKEAQQLTKVHVRWVHSEAQLANSLTKANGIRELELYYRMNHSWRIVSDEFMRSARRRRSDGLNPLEGQTEGDKKRESVCSEESVEN